MANADSHGDATLQLIGVIDGKIDTLITKVDELSHNVSGHSVDIALLKESCQRIPLLSKTVHEVEETINFAKRVLGWSAALIPLFLGLVEVWRIFRG